MSTSLLSFLSRPPVLWAAFFFLMIALPVEAFGYSLYLKDSAEKIEDEFRLEDIARISSEPNDRVPEDLLIARDLGRPVYISAALLEEKLTEINHRPDRIYGAGVWLIPRTRTIQADALQSLVREQLAQEGIDPGMLERYRVTFPADASLTVPQNGILLRFGPLTEETLRAGYRVLTCDVMPVENGATRILYRTQFNVKLWKRTQIPVAERDLPADHRIDSHDFRMEWREFDREVSSRPIAGAKVRTAIPAGEVIEARFLEFRPPVSSGRSIELVYERGPLTIRTEATALDSGQLGETIRVRPRFQGRASRRILRARVTGEGTVVLPAPGDEG